MKKQGEIEWEITWMYGAWVAKSNTGVTVWADKREKLDAWLEGVIFAPHTPRPKDESAA